MSTYERSPSVCTVPHMKGAHCSPNSLCIKAIGMFNGVCCSFCLWAFIFLILLPAKWKSFHESIKSMQRTRMHNTFYNINCSYLYICMYIICIYYVYIFIYILFANVIHTYWLHEVQVNIIITFVLFWKHSVHEFLEHLEHTLNISISFKPVVSSC